MKHCLTLFKRSPVLQIQNKTQKEYAYEMPLLQ